MKMGTERRKAMKRLSFVGVLCALVLVFGPAVAGAGVYALSARGASQVIGGATYYDLQLADQPFGSSGTGVIDPFLTIQHTPSEEGYNSDTTPVMDTTRPEWNHSLTFSQLVSGGPTVYSNSFEFLLDLNESQAQGGQLITLNKFQVYRSSTLPGDFSGTLAQLVAGSSLVYDLGSNIITFDSSLWDGSGNNIDIGIYVLKSLFAGAAPGDRIFVYAQFGGLGYFSESVSGSDAGFEEFMLRTVAAPAVPEPGTMMLLGSGLVGMAAWGRKKFRK